MNRGDSRALILSFFSLFESIMNIFFGSLLLTFIGLLFSAAQIGEILLMRTNIKFKPFFQKLLKLSSISLLFVFVIRSNNKIVIITNTLILQSQINTFVSDNGTLAISMTVIIANLSFMSIFNIFESEKNLEIVYAFIIMFFLVIYELTYLYSLYSVQPVSENQNFTQKQSTTNDLRHQMQHKYSTQIARQSSNHSPNLELLDISKKKSMPKLNLELHASYSEIQSRSQILNKERNLKPGRSINHDEDFDFELMKKDLFDIIPFGMVIMRHNKSIAYHNRRSERILGVEGQSQILESLRQLFASNNRKNELKIEAKRKVFSRQVSSRVSAGGVSQAAFENLLQQQHDMDRNNIDILDILLKPSDPSCAKFLRKFQLPYQMQMGDQLNSISSEVAGGSVLNFEGVFEMNNKRKRLSCQIIQNLPDYQKKFTFNSANLIFVLEDITKKRNFAEVQRRLKFQHQLILSFSHELKTPLNGSIQSLSLALQTCQDSGLVEDCLRPAYTSNILLMYQINDILDFAAFQSLNFAYNWSTFTFFDIASELLEIFQQPCKMKRISLILDIQTLCVPVTSDKQRILQTMVNLLNNSLRFAPQGGRIEVIVKEQSNKLSLEEVFKVSVRDNGPGLDHMKLERIQQFLINQNTATSQDIVDIDDNFDEKLIGLGFKISNRLVSGFKGSRNNFLKLKALEPSGLQVSFYVKHMIETKTFKRFDTFQKQIISLKSILSVESSGSQIINSNESIQPIKQIKINPMMLEKKQSVRTYGAQTDLAIITEERASIKQCCAQILIVDDEPFNQIPLKGLLAQYHLSSDSAYNGLEALQKVQQKFSQTCCIKNFYQMIFMDLQMPVMDGFQASKEIQRFMDQKRVSEEQRAKIIVCSAFDTLKNKSQAKAFGATEFLPKPVQKDSLREVVLRFGSSY